MTNSNLLLLTSQCIENDYFKFVLFDVVFLVCYIAFNNIKGEQKWFSLDEFALNIRYR